MKFLIDAQLPTKLAVLFRHHGYDAIHTVELPHKNRTTDMEINRITMREKRILISKDRDFIESLMVVDMPYKLLYVNTGNITNLMLFRLFDDTFTLIIESFGSSRMVELTQKQLMIRK